MPFSYMPAAPGAAIYTGQPIGTGTPRIARPAVGQGGFVYGAPRVAQQPQQGFVFGAQPAAPLNRAIAAPVQNQPMLAVAPAPIPTTIPAIASAPPVPSVGSYQWADFAGAAQPLAEHGVTPAQVYNYARATNGAQPPHVLAVEAAGDNAWANEAKKQGVLTGNPGIDHLLWLEHVKYKSGESPTDPLLSKFPASAQALQQTAEKILRNQLATQWQSTVPAVPTPTGQGYQFKGSVA
jgi:hypothetical protein